MRSFRLLAAVLTFLMVGSAAQAQTRCTTTYPMTFDANDKLVLAIAFPDTQPISPTELSFVNRLYRASADLVAVGEITGIRRMTFDDRPVSSRWLDGKWLYDIMLIKQPMLSMQGENLLAWMMNHGPAGSAQHPWVTIHTLGEQTKTISGSRVLVFASVDSPHPEFWGNFVELPDSLQKQ